MFKVISQYVLYKLDANIKMIKVGKIMIENEPISVTKLCRYLKAVDWNEVEKFMSQKVLAYIKSIKKFKVTYM